MAVRACRERGIDGVECMRDVLVRAKDVACDEDVAELTQRHRRESAAAQGSIAPRRQELRAAVQALCFSV